MSAAASWSWPSGIGMLSRLAMPAMAPLRKDGLPGVASSQLRRWPLRRPPLPASELCCYKHQHTKRDKAWTTHNS